MSLLDVLRKGVKIADDITKPLQGTVMYSRYISEDGYGNKTYSPENVPMKAIIDWRQRQVRTLSGVLSVSRATVMFLSITQIVVVTSGEGINDQDRIILPDGTTGPILDMSGFIDAQTGHPIATEVYLG